MANIFNCNEAFEDQFDFCVDNAGSVSKIWIDGLSGHTVVFNSAITHWIDSFTVGPTGIAKYFPMVDTVNFNEKSNTTANPAMIKQMKFDMAFTDITRRNEFAALIQRRCVITHLDGMGQYWQWGIEKGVKVSFEHDTGLKSSDFNVYHVTIDCEERYPAYGVDPSAMTSYEF
jgi:hypothetical protein